MSIIKKNIHTSIQKWLGLGHLCSIEKRIKEYCTGGYWLINQFNSIFYFSELYNSDKHIHVIQYLNNKIDIITKTSLDYTIRWYSKKHCWLLLGSLYKII